MPFLSLSLTLVPGLSIIIMLFVVFACCGSGPESVQFVLVFRPWVSRFHRLEWILVVLLLWGEISQQLYEAQAHVSQ